MGMLLAGIGTIEDQFIITEGNRKFIFIHLLQKGSCLY